MLVAKVVIKSVAMKKFRIQRRSLFVTGSMEMKQPCCMQLHCMAGWSQFTDYEETIDIFQIALRYSIIFKLHLLLCHSNAGLKNYLSQHKMLILMKNLFDKQKIAEIDSPPPPPPPFILCTCGSISLYYI